MIKRLKDTLYANISYFYQTLDLLDQLCWIVQSPGVQLIFSCYTFII